MSKYALERLFFSQSSSYINGSKGMMKVAGSRTSTGMIRRINLLRAILVAITAIFVISPPQIVFAQPILTVEPITWNVVGLDSNNVNVGPNNFPVGVRVCNIGPDPATNVTATFSWDDGLDLYNDTVSCPSWAIITLYPACSRILLAKH